MNGLTIKNNKGESLQVKVVRYFKINGSLYLIFSLNETDGGVEGGYTKLYVSKVSSTSGILSANTIGDDVEWNFVKDTIKLIIKANRDNGILPVQDENPLVLNNIQVLDQKVFKLNGSLVELLGANIKIQEDIVPTQIESNPIISSDVITSPEITPVMATENMVANSTNEALPDDSALKFNDIVAPLESTSIPSNDELSSEESLDVKNNMIPGLDMGMNGITPVEPAIVASVPNPNQDLIQAQSVSSLDAPLTEFQTTPVVSEQPVIDYKALYEAQLQTNQNLESQINTYKEKIEQIKLMIN